MTNLVRILHAISELTIVLKIRRHYNKKSDSLKVRAVCGIVLYFQFCKPIPVQAWQARAGPEVSRRLRLPNFQTIDT
jgi:hypothetical protein